MDRFLRTAKIKKKSRTKKGVTDTVRVTLSDGAVSHDAQIQTVDIEQTVFVAGKNSETNFKDSYRYNIGGYQLARLLGMTNVPMSVARRVDGKDAAVTWWIDDVQFDEEGRMKQAVRQGPDPERTAKQITAVRLRRADSESRPQPGQPALDQGLEALADRPHASVPPGKGTDEARAADALRSRTAHGAAWADVRGDESVDGSRDQEGRDDRRAGAARSPRQAL
jgi:hypothetical protein